MVKQLAHVCLHARDLDATQAFYRDVLGMERAFDFQRDGQPYGYYLKAGQNTFIEVFKGEPGAVGNINHLAFEVDDIDATIAQAQSCGVPTTDKKRGADQSWQCWLTDPNGVRIELHEYTDQSMQRVGGVAIATW